MTALCPVQWSVEQYLDHIPPLFGFNSFNEVANNYGGKSFRGNMQHLQNSLRNIADNHLHSHIRKNEILPNKIKLILQMILMYYCQK